MIIADVDVEN